MSCYCESYKPEKVLEGSSRIVGANSRQRVSVWRDWKWNGRKVKSQVLGKCQWQSILPQILIILEYVCFPSKSH